MRQVNRFALVMVLTAAASATSGRALAGNAPDYVGSDGLLVVRVGQSNTFAAYSKLSGKWTTHAFPPKHRAIPLLGGGGCIAFSLSGPATTELVAVDRRGVWRRQALPKPTSAPCVPFVDRNVIGCQVEDRVYAFSGLTGEWDAYPSRSGLTVDDDTVMVITPDRIAVFSAHTGSWAESPPLSGATPAADEHAGDSHAARQGHAAEDHSTGDHTHRHEAHDDHADDHGHDDHADSHAEEAHR